MTDVEVADPFDLPEWLADTEVVWRALQAVSGAHSIPGRLTGPHGESIGADLLAVDAAWPAPVCADQHRAAAHQAWHYGEVLLLRIDGSVTIAVPGSEFQADLACEALRRFVKAVGAQAERYAVQLHL
jgi:hypothetical protein